MELFPEHGRTNAKRYLDYFLSKQSYPSSVDEDLPVASNTDTLTKEEIEGECMDMARTLLFKL